MNAKTKKVLLVAHDFPPYRTSGVYRMTGLAKYLVPLGWNLTVLTAEVRGGTQDPSLLRRVPAEIEIARARSPQLAHWEDPAARALKSLGALSPRNNANRERTADAWLRRAGEFVRSCVYFPDKYVAWVPFALAKAIRLHRRNSFDVIYTSGPPRSSALIGLLLQSMLGVPWVLEFRDPWYPSPRPWRRRFEQRLHNLLLRRADAVVTVTDGHARDLQEAWRVPRRKLAVVRNGFDEDDFAHIQEDQSNPLPDGFFHLSYFGEIYKGNTGKFFLALSELANECPDLTRVLRLNVVGYSGEELSRFENDPHLKAIVHSRGFVEHDEALHIMQASDMLLLFWADPSFSRMAVAGKTYEYLRTGRPILAVASKGEIQLLIERGEAGWVVSPGDIDGIKLILKELLVGFQKGSCPGRSPRPEFAAQFRYDNLANKLACVFDRVVNHVG